MTRNPDRSDLTSKIDDVSISPPHTHFLGSVSRQIKGVFNMESMMNTKALITAVTLSLGITTTASAAVLQEFAGDYTVTNVTTTLVDTTSDTSNWIDTYSPATASGTLYYKFDVTINNNNNESGSGGFFTGITMYNGATENFSVGNGFTSLAWDSYFPGAANIQPLNGAGAYVVDQTETIIVKAEFKANAADDITIFFNPVAGVAEGDQAGSIITTRTGNLAFDRFRIRAGGGTGSTTYSNIVFATTFAEAIPEPGSLALLGIGGLLIGSRRRKD